MSPSLLLTCLRAVTLLVLATSAALYADYTSLEPTFCGAASACATVRRSGLGYVPLFGNYLPVPLFGLLGYSALMLATLLPNPRYRRATSLVLAYSGAVIALLLLLVQAVKIGQFCALCLVVDLGALLIAAFAFALGPAGFQGLGSEDGGKKASNAGFTAWVLRPWAWLSLSAVAILAPLVWPQLKPTPRVSEGISALYVPGKINVVEFADFQCPFCRILHDRLKRVLAPYGDRVNFIRMNMPLPRHEHARPAARAHMCARAQGKGEAMADALFEAELSPALPKQLAQSLGLDMGAFQDCMTSQATDDVIDRQMQLLKDAGFEGLPTTYIGDARIVGAVSEEALRESLERAAAGSESPNVPAPAYASAVLALVVLISALGRERPRSSRRENAAE